MKGVRVPACQKLPQATCAGRAVPHSPSAGCPRACLKSHVPPGLLRPLRSEAVRINYCFLKHVQETSLCRGLDGAVSTVLPPQAWSLMDQTLWQWQLSPLRLSRFLAAGGLRLTRGILPTTSQPMAPGTPRQGEGELSKSALVSGPEVTRFGGTWKDWTGQNGWLFTKRSCQEAGTQASLLRMTVRRSNGRDTERIRESNALKSLVRGQMGQNTQQKWLGNEPGTALAAAWKKTGKQVSYPFFRHVRRGVPSRAGNKASLTADSLSPWGSLCKWACGLGGRTRLRAGTAGGCQERLTGRWLRKANPARGREKRGPAVCGHRLLWRGQQGPGGRSGRAGWGHWAPGGGHAAASEHPLPSRSPAPWLEEHHLGGTVLGVWLCRPGAVFQSQAGARQRRGRDSPAHALQGLCEHLWGHAVLVLQDQALLQRHRHRRAVLGTLAAGEPDPVEAAADLPTGEQGQLGAKREGPSPGEAARGDLSTPRPSLGSKELVSRQATAQAALGWGPPHRRRLPPRGPAVHAPTWPAAPFPTLPGLALCCWPLTLSSQHSSQDTQPHRVSRPFWKSEHRPLVSTRLLIHTGGTAQQTHFPAATFCPQASPARRRPRAGWGCSPSGAGGTSAPRGKSA